MCGENRTPSLSPVSVEAADNRCRSHNASYAFFVPIPRSLNFTTPPLN